MFAIRAEKLSKEYALGGQRSGYYTLREDIAKLGKRLVRGGQPRPERDKVWALHDVTLEVGSGEVVGLIGRNGAGKTTLLKILARITEPTSGYADIVGRVGSLLEVGAGFHRELTGRENIYLNGAILGMGRAEIRGKLDEIAEFSGVTRFLDTPVKHYSSGMYLRLAFGVAAHLEPEILLVDEVLAVGDAEFQRKCLGKMQDVSAEGRTILFVSHNLAAIRKLCPRTIWIDQGRVAMDGETDDVVATYLRETFHESDAGVLEGEELRKRTESYLAPHPLFLPTSISVADGQGLAKTSFRSDEDVVVSVDYDVTQPLMNLRIVVTLVDEDGRLILKTENLDHPSAREFYLTKPGSYSSQCVIPKDMLGEQRFWIDINMICENVQHVRIERGLHFDVAFQPYNDNFAPHVGYGYIRPRLTWQTEATPAEPGSSPVNLRDRRARRDP